MSNTNNTYLAAVNSIRAYIDEKERSLVCSATLARMENEQYMRNAVFEGIATDSPLYPLASLVSASISIGRDDGCPEIRLTEEAKKALTAAHAVGLLTGARLGGIVINNIGTDRLSVANGNTHKADYEAWYALREFREAAKKAEAL